MLAHAALAAGVLLAATWAAAETPPGTLAACKAQNLRDAARCLHDRLSEDDRTALVASAGGSGIRMRIDKLVRSEFKLEDDKSPLNRWLTERGIKWPMFMSAVVIDEYLANQRSASLDLRAVAAILPKERPSAGLPTSRVKTPSNEARTPITREECARRIKLPQERIGECYIQGDKLFVIKMERAIGDNDVR